MFWIKTKGEENTCREDYGVTGLPKVKDEQVELFSNLYYSDLNYVSGAVVK